MVITDTIFHYTISDEGFSICIEITIFDVQQSARQGLGTWRFTMYHDCMNCLGWRKNENAGWLGHNGETAGFSSFIALHQEKEQAIIVLCNRERAEVEETTKALAEAL